MLSTHWGFGITVLVLAKFGRALTTENDKNQQKVYKMTQTDRNDYKINRKLQNIVLSTKVEKKILWLRFFGSYLEVNFFA